MRFRNIALGVLQVGVRITVISAGNPKIRNLGHGFIVDLVGLEARDKYVLTLSVRRKSKVNYQSMVSKQKARKTCSCPTWLTIIHFDLRETHLLSLGLYIVRPVRSID